MHLTSVKGKQARVAARKRYRRRESRSWSRRNGPVVVSWLPGREPVKVPVRGQR